MTSAPLQGVKCLVLGAGGFIGSSLARALCDQGAIVQGYGRRPRIRNDVDDRVNFMEAPFSDASALARAIEGQHILFHLLCSSVPESSNREPVEDLLSNVATTLRLLDICRTEGIRKVIFASSGGTVYGPQAVAPIPESAPTHPISAYGVHKLTIERYLELYHHLYGLDYHVLRISNPYGPGQSPFKKQGVVAATIYRALQGQDLEIWGTGATTRDFIFVDDVVRAFIAAIGFTGNERIMNVGSGKGRSVNQIVTDVLTVLDRPGANILRLPSRSADVPTNILDISRITRLTGWRPRVSWADGLRATCDWMFSEHGAESA